MQAPQSGTKQFYSFNAVFLHTFPVKIKFLVVSYRGNYPSYV